MDDGCTGTVVVDVGIGENDDRVDVVVDVDDNDVVGADDVGIDTNVVGVVVGVDDDVASDVNADDEVGPDVGADDVEDVDVVLVIDDIDTGAGDEAGVDTNAGTGVDTNADTGVDTAADTGVGTTADTDVDVNPETEVEADSDGVDGDDNNEWTVMGREGSYGSEVEVE